MIDLAQGNFGSCLAAADAADAVFGEMTEVVDRFEWPLAATERAGVYGFRGQIEAARAAADEAIRRAMEVDVPWYRGIALATRAEFCAVADQREAIADGRAALEILRVVGDKWWEGCALRALGVATGLAGYPSAAERLLQEARFVSPGRFERARCDLATAELFVAVGRHDAALDALQRCVPVFRDGGARYFLCRSLLLLDTVSPGPSRLWRQEAVEARLPDPAYDLLFPEGSSAPNGLITVRCLGEVRVEVDGDARTFLTHNAQRALLMLALAGDGGIHQEELSEALWSGAPASSARQRVRTCLWQIRKALGSAAVRLVRRGEVIVLDPAAVHVDLIGHVAEALSMATPGTGNLDRAAAEELVETLTGPILTPYQYEPWAEAWIARAERAARRLRSVLDHLPQ